MEREDDELTPATLRAVRGSSRKRRWVPFVLAGWGVVAIAVAIPTQAITRRWRSEAIELADAHRALTVAHPGWSFPAKVMSAPVPGDAPIEARLAAARALGYAGDCSGDRGTFCLKTKDVTPRRGDAIEPLTLGWLIGPDSEMREHLPLEDAPKHLIDAIMAGEDREFRQHSGVNISALARALVANVEGGGYAQGASTLTMQVVRNWNQRKERTVARKLREIVMSWAIDDHLGKDGVLQVYLDAPYLGQRGGLSVCGLQATAQH